ncbi:ubiquitin-domain-containing protein [Lactarius deliciosus]|nr:ubiquitin-domain-containing protein [Lactarius deliciosus]
MSDQAELAFVRGFSNILASQPVTFENDFQEQPEKTLKKVPVLQVDVPPPPELIKKGAAQSSAQAALQITFKSLKPPFSVTIPVSPTDPISSIKGQIAAQSHAPPADAQRLLLKGKALADAKLLQEYNVQDGDTINLMVKPGVDWDPTKSPARPALLSVDVPQETSSLTPAASSTKKRGHSRIPSVVLSTPPSPSEKPQDIQLIDADGFTVSAEIGTEVTIPHTTYRTTVSQPEYWEKLLAFLRSQFPAHPDSSIAFEDYLGASKGVLTASEIAKIRDRVGVVGMAGT